MSASGNVAEIIARAAAWGVVIFLLSIGTQWLVYEYVLDDPGGMRLISPLIAATVTAMLSFKLLMIADDRAKAVVRALQAIAGLTFHIRNALPAIEQEACAGAQPKQNVPPKPLIGSKLVDVGRVHRK